MKTFNENHHPTTFDGSEYDGFSKRETVLRLFDGTFMAVLQNDGTFKTVDGFSIFDVTAFGGTRFAQVWRYSAEYRDRRTARENYLGNFPEDYPAKFTPLAVVLL